MQTVVVEERPLSALDGWSAELMQNVLREGPARGSVAHLGGSPADALRALKDDAAVLQERPGPQCHSMLAGRSRGAQPEAGMTRLGVDSQEQMEPQHSPSALVRMTEYVAHQYVRYASMRLCDKLLVEVKHQQDHDGVQVIKNRRQPKTSLMKGRESFYR